jgi:hypothetical protein
LPARFVSTYARSTLAAAVPAQIAATSALVSAAVSQMPFAFFIAALPGSLPQSPQSSRPEWNVDPTLFCTAS